MACKPLVLGFDTSAAHCAAALLHGSDIVASMAQDMNRGQAEALMPLLEQILATASVTWKDLDALGAGVGPGNFTGIRISVSAARGLALGLNIPAMGVNTFDATTFGQTEDVVATVPAPRDQIYVSDPHFEGAPRLLAAPYASDLPIMTPPSPQELAERIAKVAASRLGTEQSAPAPYYLRAADAAPSKDRPPAIL